jgi:hypothetical protein
MATIIAPFTPVDGNSHVYANAKLYFYETGTSTPQNTFSDSALSVTNTNPVVADSNGLFSAIYLGAAPDFEGYKAILKTSGDVTIWTVDPIAGAPITVPISASLLRGYLSGLQRTANTATTLTEGAGVCADDTNTTMLSLAAGTIDCATVGANGLDAGALAVTTTYHRFAIGKTDGTVARLASTSPSSPTMPSGYTLKRRHASFRTNVSAQIINHFQNGDEFMYSTPVVGDVAAANPGISAVLRTLTLPSGLSYEAVIQGGLYNVTAVANGTLITDPATADLAPLMSAGGVLSDVPNTGNTTGAANISMVRMRVRTDTSARVRTRALYSDANVIQLINTLGWIDTRGRDD